jgi:proteic killer suppression protein
MIQSFATQGTKDIFHQENTKSGRRILPIELHAKAHRKLLFLDATKTIEELKSPPSNHLEALKGDRKGFWSIRINVQFRIVFRYESGNAIDVEICDYH